MITHYFFATPIIDYSRLFEEQSRIQTIDAYVKNFKR